MKRTVTPQLSVRIEPPIRAKLEAEATRDRLTLNAALNRRLEASFRAGKIKTIEDIADGLAKRYQKLVAAG
jgi:hypothetical protein